MSLYAATVNPLVMGVLNVTPDSFHDGGLYLDHRAAVERGRAMIAEGADIVDIGGESTRPGAEPVGEAEELRRVIPVVEALAGEVAGTKVRLSIDTRTPAVARAAASAGASIVNDVSASDAVAEAAAETGAAYVAMHSKGTPADMQDDPRYDDVVAEVSEYLAARALSAERAGIGEVWIDPGIGFGKTTGHNLALLGALSQITALGWPVLVGTSRKTFLGRIAAGGPDAAPLPTKDRFEGSLASAMWSLSCGAAAVRVHDVRATVDAVRLFDAVKAAS